MHTHSTQDRCTRCQGLMLPVWVYGPEERIRLWRCVNCGDYVDPVIQLHRVVSRLSAAATQLLAAV